MKKVEMGLPELALIAGTRGLLGAGLGMLLSRYLPRQRRMAVGWTLVAVGALSTIPLAVQVIRKVKAAPEKNGKAGPEHPAYDAVRVAPAAELADEQVPLSAEL